MSSRFDTYIHGDQRQPVTSGAELDLDPPYAEQWPSWVLRARRRRWTVVPVLELCALLLCLAAIVSVSRPEAAPLMDDPVQVNPAHVTPH